MHDLVIEAGKEYRLRNNQMVGTNPLNFFLRSSWVEPLKPVTFEALVHAGEGVDDRAYVVSNKLNLFAGQFAIITVTPKTK